MKKPITIIILSLLAIATAFYYGTHYIVTFSIEKRPEYIEIEQDVQDISSLQGSSNVFAVLGE
jgi:sensor domain CHASE-containing protein